jgi:hypothetical protein
MYLIFSKKNKIKKNIIKKIYINKFRIIRKKIYFYLLKNLISILNKINYKFFNKIKIEKKFYIKFHKFNIIYSKFMKSNITKINKNYTYKINLFFLDYLKKKYINISFFFINILLFIQTIVKLIKKSKKKNFRSNLISINYHKLNVRFFFFELFKNAKQYEWSFLISFFVFFKIIPYDYFKNFKGFNFRFYFIKSIFYIKNMFNYYFFKIIKKKRNNYSFLISFFNFKKFKKEKKFIYSNYFINKFNKIIRINKLIKKDLKKIITLKNYYLKNNSKEIKLYMYKKENKFFFNRRLKFFFFKKYKKILKKKKKKFSFKNKNKKINIKKIKFKQINSINILKNFKRKIIINYIKQINKNDIIKKKYISFYKKKNKNIMFYFYKKTKSIKKNKYLLSKIKKYFIKFKFYKIKKIKKEIKKKFINYLLLKNYKYKRFFNNFYIYNLLIIDNLKYKYNKIFNKYDYILKFNNYLLNLNNKNKLYINKIFFNFFEKQFINKYKIISLKILKNKKNFKNINFKKYRINPLKLNKLIKYKKNFERVNKIFQNQLLFKELNKIKAKEKKLHYTLYVQIKRKNLFLTAFDHTINKIILKQSLGTCYIITDVIDKKKIRKYKEKVMIKKMINVYNSYIYKGLKNINIRIVALKNTTKVKFIVSRILLGISKIKNRKIFLLNISYLNKKCHNGCRLKKKRRLKKRQSIF